MPQAFSGSVIAASGEAFQSELVTSLRGLAERALPAMYDRTRQLFVFTRKPASHGLENAGHSIRYSAITVIGLEAAKAEIPGLERDERRAVVQQLVSRIPSAALGDAALIAWAASLTGGTPATVWARLAELNPVETVQPTVEVAWAVAALSLAGPDTLAALRRRLAERLMASCHQGAHLFPHVLGGKGFRAHVGCFADQVYPIHALAEYARVSGEQRPLAVAADCASRICALQGDAGQWWWHYDVRNGSVLEEYPVYAIHQDAMAPMALRALTRAGGPCMDAHIDRGLAWLAAAPELHGRTLIDESRDMVWRKVARREPGKVSRVLQTALSRWTPGGRMPGINAVFPPREIDYEDRPYHWGWFYYAWAARAGSV
jgi:hypothetical protein